MNHPTIPHLPRPSLLTQLRLRWQELKLRHSPPPIYVGAALHLQPGAGRTTLTLATLQTYAHPVDAQTHFLGHAVNADPSLKAQQLLHVCIVPLHDIQPYPHP